MATPGDTVTRPPRLPMTGAMGRRMASGAAVAALLLGAAPAAGAKTLFTLTGHGWGHGIGLSQYGALGFAQHGWSAEQILEHYYTGANMAPYGSGVTMRVLLTRDRSAIRFASAGPIDLVEEGGTDAVRLAPGRYRAEPSELAGQLRVWGVSQGDFVARRLVGLRLEPTGEPLRLDESAGIGFTGKHWRGDFRIVREGDRLAVVDLVKMTSYLRGVVPAEVPTSWPQAALRAQAVAARSYAYTTRDPGGWFDAFATTADQVYGPIEEESAATTAAVEATASQIMWYQGSPITTFFSSSSGGRTSSLSASWGSPDRPYLMPVADPYDAAGGANPNHDWPRRVFTRETLRRALGFQRPIKHVDLVVDRPSRRVLSGSVTTSRKTTTLSGGGFLTRLDLKSTWFRIRRVSLKAPGRVHTGDAAHLTGRVWPRPGRTVPIQYRYVGGTRWRPLNESARLDADGRFDVTRRPRRSVTYRLVVRRAESPTQTVHVVARAKRLPR